MADREYYGVPPADKKEVESRAVYTASVGQTTFPAVYSVGYVDVYKNGSKLDPRVAFTATNGTSVILANAASSNDTIEIVSRRQLATVGANQQAYTEYLFTAATSNPTITVNYTPGLVMVFVNGAKWAPEDYTAANGTTITLPTANAGDSILVLSFNPFSVANALTLAGGTLTGPLYLSVGGTSVTPAAGDNSTNISTTAFSNTLVQTSSPILGTAGGTSDSITATYSPAVAALTNGMTLYVRASSANTTATPTFTPNSGTIAAKTIVKGAGSSLVAGDIAGGGHWIELQYDLTLDKWVLLNPATGISTTSVQGMFKNLQTSATGTNATVIVSADEITLEDSNNAYKTLRTVSLSINSAGSGANGLDTGSIAASTWYSIWVIYNPTTQSTAGLLSLSVTTPTMPSGYTMKARVGWIRTDGTANKFPISFKQAGREVQYAPVAGSNITAYIPMAAGGTSGVLTAIGINAYVPPTACAIQGSYVSNTANAQVAVSPNNVALMYEFTTGSTNGYGRSLFRFLLESSNIYWVESSGGTGNIYVHGWTDNL